MKSRHKALHHIRINVGTATRQRGRARVASIIHTAKRIFLDEGYENLKLQNVAAAAGISLGNLTYYFKTKEHLFQTLIDDVLEKYNADATRFMSLHSDDPILRFARFIDFVLTDCRKRESRAFFYQLWAISIHDRFVSQCRSAIYDRFEASVRDLARDLDPQMDDRTLKQRVFVLCCMTEGLMVMLGNSRRAPAHMQQFDDEFKKQALSMFAVSR